MPSTRSAWYAAGAVVTVAVLAYTAAQGATWLLPQQRANTHHIYHRPVSRVVLDLNTGNATLRVGRDRQVDVESRMSWATLARPDVEQRWRGDTLRISLRCPPGTVAGIATRCAADLALRVPAGVTIDARTESGSLRVTGTTGVTRLATADGDLTLTGTSGTVRAHADHGSVTGTDLHDVDITADVDAGDTDLRFTTAPRLVNAQTGAGDVRIAVPRGSYLVRAGVDAGTPSVDIDSDPAATSRITARTHAGDLRVSYTD